MHIVCIKILQLQDIKSKILEKSLNCEIKIDCFILFCSVVKQASTAFRQNVWDFFCFVYLFSFYFPYEFNKHFKNN